jgi:hypothetical protein
MLTAWLGRKEAEEANEAKGRAKSTPTHQIAKAAKATSSLKKVNAKDVDKTVCFLISCNDHSEFIMMAH